MIFEIALLPVREADMAAFEAAFREARPLIEASPGFVSIELRRPAEPDACYLLRVGWDSIADHRDGFRRSARYERWRGLLHRFYDPIPTVNYVAEDIACST